MIGSTYTQPRESHYISFGISMDGWMGQKAEEQKIQQYPLPRDMHDSKAQCENVKA